MTLLDPMPTDTALARWVARMVARWPLVLRSTHAAKVASLNCEIREQHMVNDTIRRDMARIMRPRFPSILDLGAGELDISAQVERMATKFSVRFEPIYYVLDERSMRVARETEYVLQEIAHEIAMHHARQYERELLRMIESRYSSSAGGRRHGRR